MTDKELIAEADSWIGPIGLRRGTVIGCLTVQPIPTVRREFIFATGSEVGEDTPRADDGADT